MRTLDMGVRIIFGFRPKKKGQTKALIEKMKQEGKPIDGQLLPCAKTYEFCLYTGQNS